MTSLAISLFYQQNAVQLVDKAFFILLESAASHCTGSWFGQLTQTVGLLFSHSFSLLKEFQHIDIVHSISYYAIVCT